MLFWVAGAALVPGLGGRGAGGVAGCSGHGGHGGRGAGGGDGGGDLFGAGGLGGKAAFVADEDVRRVSPAWSSGEDAPVPILGFSRAAPTAPTCSSFSSSFSS